MFELDPGLMIWTVVSFLILLVLLKKVGYGPIVGVLDARADSIRKALDDSEKSKKDAAKLVLEHQKKLDEVKVEVSKIIEEGKAAGENVKNDIIIKAREEAAQILTRAKADISNEKEKAMKDLQGHVADLSIQVASKVINKVLNKDDHLTLLQDCIAEVNKTA